MADAPGRVVLSGYYGFGNLGDDALFEALRGHLVAAGCESIVVPVGDPHRLPPAERVLPVGRFDFGAVRAAMRDGAVLLSGGGGLLQDATSLRSLGYYLALIELARRCRRPYAVAFCSLGPLRSRLGRAATRRALRHAASVVLRDSGSVRLALELGTPPDRVVASRDLAFGLPLPPVAGGDELIFCLRPTAHTARVIDAVAAWAAGQPAPLAFVPFSVEDQAVGDALAARLPGLNVHRQPNTVQEALGLLGRARLVVAERLHAAIFALRCGRPLVTVPYDPKVAALAADFQLPSTAPDSALTAESLAAAAAAAEGGAERRAGLCRAAEERLADDIRTLFRQLASADRA